MSAAPLPLGLFSGVAPPPRSGAARSEAAPLHPRGPPSRPQFRRRHERTALKVRACRHIPEIVYRTKCRSRSSSGSEQAWPRCETFRLTLAVARATSSSGFNKGRSRRTGSLCRPSAAGCARFGSTWKASSACSTWRRSRTECTCCTPFRKRRRELGRRTSNWVAPGTQKS